MAIFTAEAEIDVTLDDFDIDEIKEHLREYQNCDFDYLDSQDKTFLYNHLDEMEDKNRKDGNIKDALVFERLRSFFVQ